MLLLLFDLVLLLLPGVGRSASVFASFCCCCLVLVVLLLSVLGPAAAVFCRSCCSCLRLLLVLVLLAAGGRADAVLSSSRCCCMLLVVLLFSVLGTTAVVCFLCYLPRLPLRMLPTSPDIPPMYGPSSSLLGSENAANEEATSGTAEASVEYALTVDAVS